MNGTTSQSKERLRTTATLAADVSALAIGRTRSADDSLDLRYGVRVSGAVAPSSWLVFLNGRTEWVEKYAYIATDLALPDGVGFLTWDHRGQGGSGGARSYVDDYKTYAQDAQTIIAKVVGEKPYVILSHSMGALIALYGVLLGYLRPEALILCSPLLGLPDDPLPRPAARAIASLLTVCQLGTLSSGAGGFIKIPFAGNKLTHDEELYHRMQNSPYKIPGATFGWVAASFRAIEACFSPSRLKELNIPTLLLGGTVESVVDAKAFKRWVSVAQSAAPATVELLLLDGAKHELLSEIPQYYNDAVAHIRKWFAAYWR